MKEDKNYIDELYDQELGAYEMGTANQGWDAVASGLAKKGLWTMLKSGTWLGLSAGTILGVALMLSALFVLNTDNFETVENDITNTTAPTSNAIITENRNNQECREEIRNAKPAGIFTQRSNQSSLINKNTQDNLIQLDHIKSQANEPALINTEAKLSKLNTKPSTKLASEARPAPPKVKSTTSPTDFAGNVTNLLAAKNSEASSASDENFASAEEKREAEHTNNLVTYEAETYTPLMSANELFMLERRSAFMINDRVAEPSLSFANNSSWGKDLDKGFSAWNWAISAYYAPQRASIQLSTANAESGVVINHLKDGLSSPIAIDAGLRLSANNRNLSIESGLGYMEVKQNGLFSTLDYLFGEHEEWEVFDTLYMVPDSAIYYHVVGTDTITDYVYYESPVEAQDSTAIIIKDSTENSQQHDFTNTYKYLEIPLITGYSYRSGKLTTTIKTGLISSFLWQAHAQLVEGTLEKDKYTFTYDDFPKVHFNVYAGLELKYLLSSRSFMFGEAYYRRNLSSFISRNSINYNFSSYGFKFGLGMYIN